jgi:hypothetical protein
MHFRGATIVWCTSLPFHSFSTSNGINWARFVVETPRLLHCSLPTNLFCQNNAQFVFHFNKKLVDVDDHIHFCDVLFLTFRFFLVASLKTRSYINRWNPDINFTHHIPTRIHNTIVLSQRTGNVSHVSTCYWRCVRQDETVHCTHRWGESAVTLTPTRETHLLLVAIFLVVDFDRQHHPWCKHPSNCSPCESTVKCETTLDVISLVVSSTGHRYVSVCIFR